MFYHYLFTIFVDVTELIITNVPTLNNTKAGNSSIGGAIGGTVGGVISFLLIMALCVAIIWYIRHFYKKKKAYCINERVQYKANKLETDVIFYPNVCYNFVNENRMTDTIDSDIDVLTNSATNTSKSSKGIQYCMYVYIAIECGVQR